jgi:hypothetical protein
MSENETIEVHHKKGEEVIIETLAWPQKYENFIKDIIQKFKLKNNTKIDLDLITNEDDNYQIASQEDLKGYLDDNIVIDHFNAYFEETGPNDDDPADDNDNQNQEPINVNIEEINIDELMKDVFNFEEYKEKMKSDKEEFTKNFKTNLENNLDIILEKNKNEVENNIDLKLSQYIQASHKKDSNIKESILNLHDELNQIKESTEGMTVAINDLKDLIETKEVILSNANVLKDLYKNNKNNNNINNDNMDKKGKKNNLEMSGLGNPNPIDDYNVDEDNNDKILKISFEQKKIEKIIELKDAKFININEIKIKNLGNVSCKKLYFVKDLEKSTNDLCFFGNSKRTNEYELSMQGELNPNESLNCNVTMNINNPQPEQEYKIIINVKENNQIISDPFEMIFKINKPKEDPMKQKQDQANKIYEEIQNEFAAQADVDLINKENIINRLIQNNLNKDEIVTDIKNKIKEKDQKENNERAERIYGELNLYNLNLNKNEVLDYIKEKQFDKEEVQKWIDDKKPRENPQPPKQQPQPDENEEKVNQIYQELEDEYGISGFIEEEAAKDEIRKLNLDRAAINEWIENTLINGQ